MYIHILIDQRHNTIISQSFHLTLIADSAKPTGEGKNNYDIINHPHYSHIIPLPVNELRLYNHIVACVDI